jgi:hypothetical protein
VAGRQRTSAAYRSHEDEACCSRRCDGCAGVARRRECWGWGRQAGWAERCVRCLVQGAALGLGAIRLAIWSGHRPFGASGPTTWAGTPRAAFHPAEKLPRNGIGIWIDFQRPKGGPSGGALRLPLRLRNATVIEQKGAVAGLPEYLLYGRYKHPYNARVAVDFGRTSPSGRLRRVADRVLRKSFSHVGCPSGDAPPARQSVRRPPSSGVIPEH